MCIRHKLSSHKDNIIVERVLVGIWRPGFKFQINIQRGGCRKRKQYELRVRKHRVYLGNINLFCSTTVQQWTRLWEKQEEGLNIRLRAGPASKNNWESLKLSDNNCICTFEWVIWQQDAERSGREISQVDKQSKDYCLLWGKRFGHEILAMDTTWVGCPTC